MNKIVKLSVCASFFICAGCGDGGDSKASENVKSEVGQSYAWQEREQEREPEPTMSEICEEYKKALTQFLQIRKRREGLSYSVNAKVAEEMASFRGLSQSNKNKKLESLKRQLEDFQ